MALEEPNEEDLLARPTLTEEESRLHCGVRDYPPLGIGAKMAIFPLINAVMLMACLGYGTVFLGSVEGLAFAWRLV